MFYLSWGRCTLAELCLGTVMAGIKYLLDEDGRLIELELVTIDCDGDEYWEIYRKVKNGRINRSTLDQDQKRRS